MPKTIVSYIKGLVTGHKITATCLARQFAISHDGITRMLVSRFPWKKWYMWGIQRLFGLLQNGYLIIDDTVIAKPYGRSFRGASFVYSSSDDRSVFGYNIVMIVWTNGTVTIPLSWRWYKKERYTKVEIAMLLLEEVRFKWKIKQCTVVYDSWYAAAKIMRLIKRLGYHFISQIKKNRKMNGIPFSSLQIRENILFQGTVAGDIQLYYFKHEDKYYCSDISAPHTQAIHEQYQIRWKVEEVFRFLKSELKLEQCQAVRITAQKTHLVSCVLSYLILQKEQQEHITLQSLYQIHESWLFNKHIARCRINHYVKVLKLNAYC
jgi:hypothetical protein